MIGYLAIAFLAGIIAGEVVFWTIDWRERRKAARRHAEWMGRYR